MTLLNNQELLSVRGGDGKPKRRKIDGICVPLVGDVTFWQCMNIEVNCSKDFTHECGVGDIHCPNGFTTTSF